MSDLQHLKEYIKNLEINFNDINLFQQVFVHRSYLNENRGFPLSHNERLEFLGDAVLELVVTEYLYLNYDRPEGELTAWRSALVKGEMLSKIATEIDMEPHLLLSRGEQKGSGKARDLILANALEALLGAIYLDQGYEVTGKFISKHIISKLDQVIEAEMHIDAKSKLQELSQEQLGVTPTYLVLEEKGPDHAKEFKVGVYIGEKMLAVGEGQSKQKAEQQAATLALEGWQNQ